MVSSHTEAGHPVETQVYLPPVILYAAIIIVSNLSEVGGIYDHNGENTDRRLITLISYIIDSSPDGQFAKGSEYDFGAANATFTCTGEKAVSADQVR